jgi:hypothetical protein
MKLEKIHSKTLIAINKRISQWQLQPMALIIQKQLNYGQENCFKKLLKLVGLNCKALY